MKKETIKYQAVTVGELKRILPWPNSSPDQSRNGYVIGPDATGRLCHVASCYTLQDAEKTAKRLNKEESSNG